MDDVRPSKVFDESENFTHLPLPQRPSLPIGLPFTTVHRFQACCQPTKVVSVTIDTAAKILVSATRCISLSKKDGLAAFLSERTAFHTVSGCHLFRETLRVRSNNFKVCGDTLRYGQREYLVRLTLTDIRPPHAPTVALTHQLSHYLSHYLFFIPHTCSLHSPNPFFISLCYSALALFSFFYSTMVSTRGKNKVVHPAAPVMSDNAKRKAGIKTKARSRRVTKDQQIRELKAQVFALENPGSDPFSKEPLVCIIQCQTTLPNARC